MRIEASAAPRLIGPCRSHYDAFTPVNQALGKTCGTSATDADCVSFLYVFCNCQQLRHRFERAPKIIHIEARDNDALTLIRKVVSDPDKVLIEKLAFVDADHVRVNVNQCE